MNYNYYFFFFGNEVARVRLGVIFLVRFYNRGVEGSLRFIKILVLCEFFRFEDG